MKKHKPIKGFTLIELSLSMVFISLLSLAIVLIIMNTISSYRRGLTMNLVNSVGQEIIDDIRVAIQNSSAVSIKNQCGNWFEDDTSSRDNCVNNNGAYLVSISKYQSVSIEGQTSAIDAPVYGAICTGKYSYVWNSGYTFSNTSIAKASLKVTGDGGKSYSNFRLIKVSDERRRICSQKISKYPSGGGQGITIDSPEFTISVDESGGEEPFELLDSSNDLAIYNMSLFAPAESNDGTNLFYSGSLILGTIRGGPNINSSDGICKTPSSAASDLNYCAINKFKFAVQARSNGA